MYKTITRVSDGATFAINPFQISNYNEDGTTNSNQGACHTVNPTIDLSAYAGEEIWIKIRMEHPTPAETHSSFATSGIPMSRTAVRIEAVKITAEEESAPVEIVEETDATGLYLLEDDFRSLQDGFTAWKQKREYSGVATYTNGSYYHGLIPASAWGSTVDGIGNFTIKPDLFIVAFGMNDMYTSVETYYDNMNKIVAEARKINVNSEIVLVSSMLPNPEVMRYDSANPAVVQTLYGGNIPLFEDELIKISNENTGIAVVPMTSVTTAIYATGKRFEDVNSNNLNHPNDYIHRIYAQTVLKVMLGDEFTAL